MDDYISRRAAINVIERNRAYIGHNMERAVGAAFIEILNCVGEDIGRLPSIQLATDTNAGTKLGTDLAQLGTDCISRQAAIDALAELQGRASSKGELTGISKAWKRIKQLPSAQPKRGRWIRNGWAITCSECGYDMPYTVRNFCPNCGSYNGCENEIQDNKQNPFVQIS